MDDPRTGGLHIFDDIATSYEDWYETRLGRFVSRKERDLLIRLLQPKPGERLLEIGAGTGHFLRPLAAQGVTCVGLDPSLPMIRSAREAGSRADIRYLLGRGEMLPFQDGAFDALLCMTVLEFVEDVEAVLRDAMRVLRPNGRLVLGVLNADSPWAGERRSRGGLWRHARFFRASELTALAAPAGVLEIAYCVHLPPRLSSLPSPLLNVADWLGGKLAYRRGALLAARIMKGTV